MGGWSVEVSFFCTSISVIRMAGAEADTGTEPDSAPQISVEDFHGVAGGDDFGERNERRAHDVHAAHQFVRAAVGEHFVNDQRLAPGTLAAGRGR